MGLLDNAKNEVFHKVNYLKTHLHYAPLPIAKIIFVTVRYAYRESGGFMLM